MLLLTLAILPWSNTPYTGSDDIMIGDGSGIPITHTSSTSLPKHSHNSFQLNNVLCIPEMKKNLISISQIFFIQTMFPLNSYHLFLL
jgi:hypothetical protein